MILAQANAVQAAFLHQAWILGVVILGLFLGPMTAVYVSGRRQKREVVQGEEFVTKSACALTNHALRQEVSVLKGDLGLLRNRVDTVESDVNRSIRELRSEVMTALTGLRGEVTQLVQAVGRLQGQIELDRRRDERS